MRRTSGQMRKWAIRLRISVWVGIAAMNLLSGPLISGQLAAGDFPLTVMVKDEKGRPVSGAEILVSEDNQPSAQLLTDANGKGTMRLKWGTLHISAHRSGYISVQETIDAETIPEHILRLQLAQTPQINETVTVQATIPSIAEETSSPGTEIKPVEAKDTPSQPLTLTDALPLVPGVVRAPDGQIQIEGAGEAHSALLVNSVDATDPATGQFGLSVPIDVVDSLHVITTPYSARYGRFTAGVVTAETRPGGNKWHFDLNDPLPEFRIRSGHLRGARSVTPRISFGGPIVKDRVFFSEGTEYVMNKIPVRTLYFPFNETKINSFNSFTQTDFTLTPRQTLTASFHAAPHSIRYANLNFFNPQEVTPNGDTQSYTGSLFHRLAIGGGLLQSTFALSDIATSVSAQGDQGMMARPAGNSGNYFAEQQRNSGRFEWNELWSLAPLNSRHGAHRLQLGSSIISSGDEGQLHARTITLFDNQGAKVRTIDFTQGSPYDRNDVEPAFFLQDHWALTQHVALDAGVRFEAQTITGTTRVAPRMGFLWNPDAANRTMVRGGIGTFYDSVPLNVYAFSHYPEQIITTYVPGGSIIDGPRHYLNLTDEAAQSQFPLVDREQKAGNFAPYTVAWNVEIDHRFSTYLTMRAKYLESHGSGVITISPQIIQGQDAFVLGSSGNSQYRQFELTARITLQRNHQIYASYVRNLSKGYLNESGTYLGDFASPFIRSSGYTNRSGDLPNRFLTWGAVALPWRMKIFPMIELRNGFPYQSLDVYQNYIQNKAGRFPLFFSADARLAKDIPVNAKYTLELSMTVTNVTNHFNALEVHANTGDPQYGQFFGNYDRKLRVDFDVLF